MHFISRREKEGIVIDNDIKVTVLDIHEDHVRLAVSSPKDRPSYWEQTLYLESEESRQTLQTH